MPDPVNHNVNNAHDSRKQIWGLRMFLGTAPILESVAIL